MVWNKKVAHDASLDEKTLTALYQILQEGYEEMCDSIAMVLMLNHDTSERFLTLPSMLRAFKRVGFYQKINETNLQELQLNLLLFLRTNADTSFIQSILERFDLLHKEGIVNDEHFKTLKSINEHTKSPKIPSLHVSLHVKEEDASKNHYTKALNTLLSAIETTHKVLEAPYLQERLDGMSKRLENQRFSIGVTGVMNAGKSTLLNALLGKELLGTSVIPETANLTVIHYAKEPYAIVHFWSRKEWERIEENAKNIERLSLFIKESREHFKETFETLITLKGESKRIDINDLSLYTSAKHSDKKCNLVKSVELYTDLKYLQEGVSIVDTPGLDDPVIVREEITLEYLSECDLMVHLMNAAQAVTQKDVDFIIDALLYRNVAQLLVVITRIDTISPQELEEVIVYTKQSIEARLREYNKSAKLDEVIAKIVFIPVAAKMALLHRLGRHDETAGYDMERTGLLDVETYFEDVLFGKNAQKANLILSSNQKELESILTEALRVSQNELEFLSLSFEEIEKIHAKWDEDKKATLFFLEQIDKMLFESKQQMQRYFLTLHTLIDHRLESLQAVLKRRIGDDVAYTFKKEKKAPKEERINTMIETAMRDGLIDLVRDYRYEFEKKMENSLAEIEATYGEFKTKSQELHFDVRTFAQEYLGGVFLFKNTIITCSLVNEAIKKHGKNDMSALLLALDSIFGAEFLHMKERINEKLISINAMLLEAFLTRCKAPAQAIKERLGAQEASLERAMDQVKNQHFNRTKRRAEIEQNVGVMERVLSEVRAMRNEK